MAIESKFISYSDVFHKRTTPRENAFNYHVFYICFDINKINDLKSKLFSINRFNIFSFYEKDHGLKDGSSIKDWAQNLFKSHNIQNIDKIFLHTHPRIFGYVFNPVSFWIALDKNENIRAIIAQVNNTFNESHCYLIYNHDGSQILPDQWFEADKEFHVSPFYQTEGSYKFRFIFNQKNIAVWIDYFINEKTLLTSVVSKKRVSLNDINLAQALIAIPFMTLKVIILIHWQALKIFIKKIKYIPKPLQRNIKITQNKT